MVNFLDDPVEQDRRRGRQSLLSVSTAARRHADLMPNVVGTVLDTVVDAVTGRAGSATLFAALVVASFLLGARVLARYRYARLGLRVAGLLTALTAVTLGINSDGWVRSLDVAITSWLAAHRSLGLDVAATVITDFGSPVATAAGCVICASLLYWLDNSLVPGIVVIGTVGASAVACTTLKAVVGRPRPPVQWQVVLETDPSFPSGHVTGTAALLGIIAVVVGSNRGRATRAWLAVTVGSGVVMVAATRLYLGVHWLTDVTAGAILAAVFVTIGAAVFDAVGPVGATHPSQPGSRQYRRADDRDLDMRIIGCPSREELVRFATPALSVVMTAVATVSVLGGCAAGGRGPSGSAAHSGTAASAAPESNPAGDIPDTQVFVPFSSPGGLFTVSVPEGWARTTDRAATIFADNANTVRIETADPADAPNTESVQVDELPAIASSTPGYRPGTVTAAQRKAGPVIVITYQGTSAPDPVTGKTGIDAFERDDYWRNGREVILTLSSPVGADNVDSWRTITDSLQWT
jgi:membrane-associated phospholipid phosphatase